MKTRKLILPKQSAEPSEFYHSSFILTLIIISRIFSLNPIKEEALLDEVLGWKN